MTKQKKNKFQSKHFKYLEMYEDSQENFFDEIKEKTKDWIKIETWKNDLDAFYNFENEENEEEPEPPFVIEDKHTNNPVSIYLDSMANNLYSEEKEFNIVLKKSRKNPLKLNIDQNKSFLKCLLDLVLVETSVNEELLTELMENNTTQS